MALSKDWRDLPAVLAPTTGETLEAWHARIAAYDAANPGALTKLNAVALEDIEARVQAELNAKVGTPGAHTITARALNTAYQPSATRPVLVLATVSLTAPGGGRVDVNVRCDASTPPAKLIARVVHIVPAGSSDTTVYKVVTFLVPAGFYYRLASANVSAGASVFVDQVAEQAL